MSERTRLLCDECRELVSGFPSVMTIMLCTGLDGQTTRCEVCGRTDMPGHVMHHAAAEAAHRRLCEKMQAARNG